MAQESKYKAVILAGGKGTRLYPITKEIPKPLIPVGQRPIINYLVDLFLDRGQVDEIFVLTPQAFADEFDWWKKRYYPEKNINFFAEQEPLGTFGGLWHLKEQLAGNDFFLTNGDELKEVELKDMMSFHKEKDLAATLALVRVPNPQDYGVVLATKGIVDSFLEKPANPPTDYISSGLYVFSPEVFKYHPGPGFSMVEKDLFPKLAQEKRLAAFQFQGDWFDCGTWERYEKALEYLKNKKVARELGG